MYLSYLYKGFADYNNKWSLMFVNLRDSLAVRFNLCFAKFWIFFFVKIECGLYFLNRFDVLMLKMVFKK